MYFLRESVSVTTTRHSMPTFDDSHNETMHLQQIEAKKHPKFNTMEQARLDAIARMIQSDRPNAQNAKNKLKTSIKMDRKPEYSTDDQIKELQQSHFDTHKKINTFEQSKLDAIARLAAADNKHAMAAKKMQQSALLQSNKSEENVNVSEKQIRRQIKEEYDEKMKNMQRNFQDLINARIKKEKKAQKLLEDSQAKMQLLEKTLMELEQDKIRLIKSTSNEIEILRDALRSCS